MTQYDFGTINPATTTGGDLATLLQNWRDAVLTGHSGTSRPFYIKAGQIWINTTTSNNWVINLYDGAEDIPLGYVNTSDDTAGFLTRSTVTTKTASATITVSERNMLVGIIASTANITLALPTALTAKNGFAIKFQKRDNTAFTITITRGASDLINGATSYVLAQQYDAGEMVCDGTANWYAYGGILDAAIRTAKLADGAVTTPKIADGAVTSSKLATAVTSLLMPVGSLMPFAGADAPSGWLLCGGQAVSRTTYAALFAVIGTIYGAGDGTTTFNLPDARGRVLAGADDMGGVRANRIGTMVGWWRGAVGGYETHTLSVNEIPPHSHNFSWNNRTRGDGGGNVADQIATSGLEFTVATQNTGAGWAHNNLQPTLVANYIIKV